MGNSFTRREAMTTGAAALAGVAGRGLPLPEYASDDQLQKAIQEQQKRGKEGVRLYRPRPEQMPFHLSRASERLVRGGNRSGKTISASVEVASAALGIPLTGPDDKEMLFRYPTDRPLVIWIIGYDQKHIARMYRKLFTKGLFKVIRDKKTKELRTWRPWDPDDMAREKQAKPSPPLIPPRMVAEWGWESKSERVFNVCRLTNGTEIHAYTSGGEVGVGDAVDLIWIDEDIQIPAHYEEWQARLSDVRGRIIWSSWPRSANEAMVRLSKRADEESEAEDPDVSEIILTFSGNPYIPKDEKQKRIRGWAAAGEAVVRARDQGQYTIDTVLVFPDFNIRLHALPSEVQRSPLDDHLKALKYQVPLEWTYYLTVDPGHTCAAALAAAIPPPELGDYVLIIGECCLKGVDAFQHARAIARKWPGVTWEAFIIDWHAARTTPMGFGKKVGEQYRDAFREAGLESRRTGHGFKRGSDDINARNALVREWLRVRQDGTTRFRCFKRTTEQMQEEFGLYRKRVAKEEVEDKVIGRRDHTMDCLGYLASRNPKYVRPEEEMPKHDPVDRVLSQLRGDAPQGSGAQSFYMGPGRAPMGSLVA